MMFPPSETRVFWTPWSPDDLRASLFLASPFVHPWKVDISGNAVITKIASDGRSFRITLLDRSRRFGMDGLFVECHVASERNGSRIEARTSPPRFELIWTVPRAMANGLLLGIALIFVSLLGVNPGIWGAGAWIICMSVMAAARIANYQRVWQDAVGEDWVGAYMRRRFSAIEMESASATSAESARSKP